jgi:hypothetical protein
MQDDIHTADQQMLVIVLIWRMGKNRHNFPFHCKLTILKNFKLKRCQIVKIANLIIMSSSFFNLLDNINFLTILYAHPKWLN